MVLSSHSLAVERRRWTERRKKIGPDQWRLCRFCYASIGNLSSFLWCTLASHHQFLTAVAGQPEKNSFLRSRGEMLHAPYKGMKEIYSW
ncbi:hypothetical protein B0H14DRAFT_2342017 [Mycena olivaceomarginata]|nr:hypothetical protein B0H14DRAFT_2342017 [Mycena olivaceomarginata]